MRILLLILLITASASVSLRAEPAAPDEEARFLAGLPMAGTALFAQSQSAAWAAHAVAFDKAWQKLERRQLEPIASWMGERFGAERDATDPLLYLFSGPDFLYAHTFFPQAGVYVLCGIEPIGPLPDVQKIASEALGPALQGLEKSLSSVLQFSFFITKDMKVDLQNAKLAGTLPVLYTFLARSGCHLDAVELVSLGADGTLREGAVGPAPAVKIVFSHPGQAAQTLYYFSTDLSDGPVQHSGFLKWLATLGPAGGFVKAASYLMHGNNFTKVRQRLLEQSRFLIQDDSGIPVRFFEPGQWNLGTYGRYLPPLPLFKQPPQPLLTDLYEQRGSSSLPFSFGYRWNPAESTLLAATRLGPETPAAAELPVRRAEPVH